MNKRMARAAIHQQRTLEKLRALGNKAEPYGQEMVPPATRELLRASPIPAPERWIADYIVYPAHGTEPVLVDAKYAESRHVGNHSIEIRSLLHARLEHRTTFYVCATLIEATGEFVDWKSIEASLVPTSWACCSTCADIYRNLSPEDAFRALPTYCPERQRSESASQTPFFVIHRDCFSPDADIFGITPDPPETARAVDWRRISLTEAHKWCKFRAGSLWCVNGDDCQNPNHRAPTSAGAE